MKNEIIVFELPDESIRILACPAKGKRSGEIKSVWLNRVFKKSVTDHAQYAGAVRIKDAKTPGGSPVVENPGELFCDAWRHSGGGQLQVDMPEARKIKMDRNRTERAPRLNALDKDWMRATGQGDSGTASTVEARRQILRDLPATFDLDAISTPEELEAFQPAWP